MSKKLISCKICNNKELVHFGEKEGYNYWCCPLCLFLFSPDIDKTDIEHQYAQGIREDKENDPYHGWVTSLDFVQPYFEIAGEEKSTIFDFGTGNSILPDLLRNKGHDVWSIDLKPPLNQIDRKRLTGNINEIDISPFYEKFDLIISFQVFEHLTNPMEIMKRFILMLKQGGCILIHTDMENPERFASGLDWEYINPPDHCSIYRNKTFKVMAKLLKLKFIYHNTWVVILKKYFQ